jgi:hypothetical protein
MPRNRSTFNKRQKEQARQQKQRDKAQRRSERRREKSESTANPTDDLREHAEAQAALFRVGHEKLNFAERSEEVKAGSDSTPGNGAES